MSRIRKQSRRNFGPMEIRGDVAYLRGSNTAPVLAEVRPSGAVDDYERHKTFATRDDWLNDRAGVDILEVEDDEPFDITTCQGCGKYSDSFGTHVRNGEECGQFL